MILVVLFILLFFRTASAELLVVPTIGDGKSEATSYTADKSVLPKSVQKWKGIMVEKVNCLPGKNSCFYIEVNENFASETPTLNWRKPLKSEVDAELTKLGVDPTKVIPLPTVMGQLIERGWNLLETPSAFAASFSDTFPGSNESPIAVNWTSGLTGVVAVNLISNQLNIATASDGGEGIAFWDANTIGTAQWSEVTATVVTGTGNRAAGVVLYGDDAPSTTYVACILKSADSKIYYNNGGTYADLAAGAETLAQGDKVYCSVDSLGNFTMKENGVTILTGSAAPISAGQPGVFVSATNATTDVAVDNWSGGDLSNRRILKIKVE